MPVARKRLRTRLASIALSVSLIAGCATGTDPRDPLEPFNRGVYNFNENVDRAILKPIAQAYRAVLPQFVRSSVSNFFSNVNDVVVALNNLLQGKFTTAYSDFGRIAINSTVGVLGLFDVASEAGIEKHDEDFGQTLGWWGMENGPFIMIPFLGPSTGRDAVGRVADVFSDPVTYVDPTRARNQLWGVRIVNRRAELLDASTVLQTAALDPYEFVRDAYLQRRRNLVHDGAPPPDREFLDPPAKPRSSVPQPAAARIAEAAPARAFEPASRRPHAPITVQASVARESPFPSSAGIVGPGSILVSGDARTPVQSAYTEQPSPHAETARLPTLAQLWRALTSQ
ncbi:MAG TPA: VacJ family lipoprotein [Burkholderiales bacterium]|nr:VacJ family lipoprotein [Burkholderiales bacterium]